MWKIYYLDIVNNCEFEWPPEPTRERALRQACAIRRQTGKKLLRVIDPSNREVPKAEIEEYCRALPPMP
jgi:hypothetical protein